MCGAPVCRDFDGILRFFPVSGPLCVGTMRFQGFFALCRAPVYGNFEILRFSPVCGPCVGDFENFPKKSPIGKNPGCGDLKWQ